ncbi:MAG: DUF11 domain-containing protein [Puniceicoccales bacterium]|jgi:uncharacterized repeat protein (TIGR01451 family)|nr:DUF11 domain-containing protein [Puniceicoccales bacterium]
MSKKLFVGFAALLAAMIGPISSVCAESSDPVISGTFSKEHPSRFDSDLYSVEKKLLEHNDDRTHFNYRLTFRAQRDMNNILLVESLPEGVSLEKATPEPDRINGKEIFWRVSELAAGTERSVDLSVKAEHPGTFITRSWVTADATVALPIVSDTPGGLNVTKICPEYVETGEVIPYKITVTNTGMRIAKNVQVMEIPPPTLSMGNFHPQIGDLKPGESREIMLTGRTTVKGKHTNLVRAFMDGVEIPAEAKATVIVADPPQVNFMKRGGGTVFVTKPVVYQIIVRNDGDMPVRNIVVTDSFPSGVQLLSASESPKVTWAGKETAGSLEWKVDSLAPGGMMAFEYSLVSNAPLKLETAARVEATAATGKQYSAQSKAETHWKGVPGVLTEISDNKDPILVGDETVYKIRVVNQGEHEPISTKLVLRLTSVLRPMSVSGISGENIDGQTVLLPDIILAPKEERSFELTARGLAAGTGKITLELRADFLKEPVVKEETTLVY